jgi:hypothetical protein
MRFQVNGLALYLLAALVVGVIVFAITNGLVGDFTLSR